MILSMEKYLKAVFFFVLFFSFHKHLILEKSNTCSSEYTANIVAASAVSGLAFSD